MQLRSLPPIALCGLVLGQIEYVLAQADDDEFAGVASAQVDSPPATVDNPAAEQKPRSWNFNGWKLNGDMTER